MFMPELFSAPSVLSALGPVRSSQQHSSTGRAFRERNTTRKTSLNVTRTLWRNTVTLPRLHMKSTVIRRTPDGV